MRIFSTRDRRHDTAWGKGAPGRLRGVLGAMAFASAAVAALPAAATGTLSPKVSCASLTGLAIANTQVLTATEVAAGGGLPAHCTVVGVINKQVSTQDPTITPTGSASRSTCRTAGSAGSK